MLLLYNKKGLKGITMLANNEILTIGLLVSAIVVILFAVGVTVWTYFTIRKNKRMVDMQELQSKMISKDMLFSMLGGAPNVKILKKEEDCIMIEVIEEDKVIIEELRSIPRINKVKKDGKKIYIYSHDIDEIYKEINFL